VVATGAAAANSAAGGTEVALRTGVPVLEGGSGSSSASVPDAAGTARVAIGTVMPNALRIGMDPESSGARGENRLSTSMSAPMCPSRCLAQNAARGARQEVNARIDADDQFVVADAQPVAIVQRQRTGDGGRLLGVVDEHALVLRSLSQ